MGVLAIEMLPDTEHIHPFVSQGGLMVVSLLWAGSLVPSSTAPSRAAARGQLTLDAASSWTRLPWSDPAWLLRLGGWKNP